MLRHGIAADLARLRWHWWRGVYRAARWVATEALWRAAVIERGWEK